MVRLNILTILRFILRKLFHRIYYHCVCVCVWRNFNEIFKDHCRFHNRRSAKKSRWQPSAIWIVLRCVLFDERNASAFHRIRFAFRSYLVWFILTGWFADPKFWTEKLFAYTRFTLYFLIHYSRKGQGKKPVLYFSLL